MEPEGRDDPLDQGGISMKDKPTISGYCLVKKERKLVYLSTHENPGDEVEELSTNIYIFLTCDGTNRVKVVEHEGWSSWADKSVIVERVTPPDLHTFTLATSSSNKKFIAVATRR
ncbi:hypothetical protein NC652_008406 [Populus alba x Populus x berolinensis]|nr:hypothetical protein NC652_008406 [Populus alba x Populus x berolinensis]